MTTTTTAAAVAPVRRWILFLHERSGVSKRGARVTAGMIDGDMDRGEPIGRWEAVGGEEGGRAIGGYEDV